MKRKDKKLFIYRALIYLDYRLSPWDTQLAQNSSSRSSSNDNDNNNKNNNNNNKNKNNNNKTV